MSEYAQLRNVDPNLADRYHAALQKALEGREEGLSFEEIQAIIDEVNEQVRRERLCEWCYVHSCWIHPQDSACVLLLCVL